VGRCRESEWLDGYLKAPRGTFFASQSASKYARPCQGPMDQDGIQPCSTCRVGLVAYLGHPASPRHHELTCQVALADGRPIKHLAKVSLDGNQAPLFLIATNGNRL